MNKKTLLLIGIVIMLLTVSFVSANSEYVETVYNVAGACTPTLGSYSRGQGIQPYNTTMKYLKGISLWVYDETAPTGIEIHITNTSSNKPVYDQSYGSINLTSAELTFDAWNDFNFTDGYYAALTPATQFHIGMDSLGGSDLYHLCYSTTSTYSRGTASYQTYAGRYTSSGWSLETNFDYRMLLYWADWDGGIDTPNNFTISAKDIYDNSSISNFSATINSEVYSTTTGSIITNLLVNDTNTYDIDVYNAINSKGDYFNKTFTNIDITSNYIAYLDQSYISFNAFDLLNNSVEGTFYINGVLIPDFTPIKAGSYNVTFVNSSYFNKTTEITVSALTNNTYNVTGVYDSQLYITAKDAILNTTINIFSGYAFDNNNSINNSFSTTNGVAIVPILLGTEQLIYIIGSGYTTNTSTITANVTNTTYSTVLYGFNSVVIQAFYLANSTLINDKTLTVNTISSLSSQTNTTTTGNLVLNFLNPLSYEVRISGLDLITNSKFITVVNDSTQQINFYMTLNDTPELQTFQILDTSNSEVQGAILWVQKENLNGGDLWVTVAEIETNNEGYAYAYINKRSGNYYRFAVKYNGEFKPIEPTGETYTSKTSYITDVNTINQIVINLQESTTDFITNILSIGCNISYSGVNDTVVNFNFADSNNAIVGGKILVKGRYLTTSTSYEDLYSYQQNSSTGSLSYNFTVLNNTIYQIQGIIVFSDHTEICTTSTKRFDADTIIDKNTGLLYAILIIAVVALLTARFGSLISTVFSVGSIIPLTIFGIVDLPISIISSFIVLAIILFGRQKGDNSDSGGGGL